MAVAAFALAASGDLDAPALTIVTGSPAADYAKVKAVLERRDCKFLSGGWLDKHTSRRGGGDTTAPNTFIAASSACPGVTVHVGFHRPASGTADWDSMVAQAAPAHELVLRTNLASEAVRVEKLYLPPTKAGRTPV